MKKLNLNLEHCYGIRKLKHNLDFKKRTYAIYAPNGVMKTSFARPMLDLSKGEVPKDLAFPDRETTCQIFVDEAPIDQKNIFVIESYNADFKSEKISTLLANKELKQEYEVIHKDIDKAKLALNKKLKSLSGLTGRKDNIEETISNVFDKPFYDALFDIEENLKDHTDLPFNDISYQVVYNEKVLSFLETKDFKASLKNYIEKYDELIQNSPYLGKEFKFYHAEAVQKQLVSNNFFKGGHTVNLFDGFNKNECSSEDDLHAILQAEKDKIFSDSDLKKKFDEISDKLSNKELKEFRDYLLEHQELLPELTNLTKLSKQLWLAYFDDQRTLFIDLIDKYRAGQEKIKALLDRARTEKTVWEDVIRIFNSRFSHLPFQVKIKNKEDVILKSEVETIEFSFQDSTGQRKFDSKDELLKILSTGERRALYILNIMFEMEARKKEDGYTLFIVDDIADSFDYKNKYAIVEYLKHISDVDKFYMIILTHNFDFLRTIESRTVAPTHQCLMAVKYDTDIKLERFSRSYIRNPFEKWKSDLNNDINLIASIPFVRNVIEYTQGINDDYNAITSLLHYKEETPSLTIKTLKQIYCKTFTNINFPSDKDTKNILDLIFETADSCLSASEGINLENKIVLSIATRLRAEKFMISKISDQSIIKSDQTWILMTRYEQEYNNEKEFIEILKRVVLITPANIHINAFMYEPILDMGDRDLRDLYSSVKNVLI